MEQGVELSLEERHTYPTLAEKKLNFKDSDKDVAVHSH